MCHHQVANPRMSQNDHKSDRPTTTYDMVIPWLDALHVEVALLRRVWWIVMGAAFVEIVPEHTPHQTVWDVQERLPEEL